MSQDTNLKSKYEASLLEKYSSMFPLAFIECVKNGVTWLANHNGLTYQTSALISTDNVVYEANKNSILKIGLINVDKPLSGMSYYSVRSIIEEKDSISGNTIFKVKLDYTAPVGIEIMMIPISYFSPYAEDGASLYYTKEEVVALIQSIKSNLDLEVNEKLLEVKKEVKTYVDGLMGSFDGLDLEFPELDTEVPSEPSNPGVPSVPGEQPQVPQKPATPLQKIVEHLHSLSMNLSELGKEHNSNQSTIAEVQEAVKQLQASLAEGGIATPDLNPGVVELPPYYTKDEVDLRLATKVSNVIFEEYVSEAENKFAAKEPTVEVPESKPDVEVPPKEEELPQPPVVDQEQIQPEGDKGDQGETQPETQDQEAIPQPDKEEQIPDAGENTDKVEPSEPLPESQEGDSPVEQPEVIAPVPSPGETTEGGSEPQTVPEAESQDSAPESSTEEEVKS